MTERPAFDQEVHQWLHACLALRRMRRTVHNARMDEHQLEPILDDRRKHTVLDDAHRKCARLLRVHP
jgi:hypothetical protein